MTKATTQQSTIAHVFQSLAAELDQIAETDRAAYLARVAVILGQELNNPALFAQVLARAKGAA